MDKIKVYILPDGVNAIEKNPIGELGFNGTFMGDINSYHKLYQSAQEKLRTFQIDTSHVHILRGHEHRYEEGSIREAEILPNGKIKIVS